MKRVAFLTDGWKRLLTYAWNVGIKEAIADYEEDVMVYQFNSFGNWSSSAAFSQGEYSIYKFPDLSEYDGILMDVTNVTDEQVLAEMVELIKASKTPAVSLGKEIDGLYYVGIDNMRTIHHLTEHLYEKHQCRRFLFAGGPIGNCDNIERQQAYVDFLQEKAWH